MPGNFCTICPQLQVPEKIYRFICFSIGTTRFWQMIRHIPIFSFQVQNVQYHLSKHSHRKFHSNGKRSVLPFCQKIRKFRFEVKWKGNFPENFFRNCGQPPEVVLFSVQNGIREMPLPFVRIVPFPGLFSQDRVNMRDGTQSSNMFSGILIRLVIKFRKSLTFNLCDDHSIRIIG